MTITVHIFNRQPKPQDQAQLRLELARLQQPGDRLQLGQGRAARLVETREHQPARQVPALERKA